MFLKNKDALNIIRSESNEMLDSELQATDELLIVKYLNKRDIPRPILELLRTCKTDEERDMLFVSLLVALSSVLPHLYFTHGSNQKAYDANLISVIAARSASGKGAINVARQIVYPIDKLDSQKPLLLPSNATLPAIIQQLAKQEGHGLIIETEASTIADLWSKGNLSSYSSTLRLAAEHEPITYARKTGGINITINHPNLSALIAGTYKQINALLQSSSIEDGLSSRVLPLLVQKKEEKFDASVFNQSRIKKNPQDTISEIADQILQIYEQLMSLDKPILFRLTREMEKEIGMKFSQLDEAYRTQLGDNFSPFLKRMAVHTLRIAMILTAWKWVENGEIPPRVLQDNKVVCSKDILEMAMLITRKLLLHSANLFLQMGGDKIECVPTLCCDVQWDLFWDALPNEFKRKDAVAIAKTNGFSERTLDRHLKSWLTSGKLKLGPVYGCYAKAA